MAKLVIVRLWACYLLLRDPFLSQRSRVMTLGMRSLPVEDKTLLLYAIKTTIETQQQNQTLGEKQQTVAVSGREVNCIR
jgi:hypothetical protein